MARVSPLFRLHQQAEALFRPWGPDGAGIDLVETFGEIEAEYAALRKGCVLLDLPTRGTIRVAGADARAFLQRMLTQDMSMLEPGRAVRAFWLSRKGRIDADLRVIAVEGGFVLDLDAHAVQRTVDTLGAYVIADDVTIEDRTPEAHRLALHGPTAAALLARVADPADAHAIAALEPGRALETRLGPARVLVDRQDSAGETGLELLMPVEHAQAVYEQLLEAGLDHDGPGEGARYRLRPAGWHAYNIARVEAGWPVYYLDFGPDSLPHETGVLHDRVSFRKGCYLGQEIVARMESLGKPAKVLVALRGQRLSGPDGHPAQPETGSAILPSPAAGEGGAAAAPATAQAVGVVTSSVLSPMLGSSPICLAVIKTRHAEAGAVVRAETPAGPIDMTIQPALTQWSRSRSESA